MQVRAKGLVSYPCLNSYVAELWGVLQACLLSPHCIRIFCDCNSVVVHAQHVFATGCVDDSWLCQDWWKCLAQLTQHRLQTHPQPFEAQWIPADCFEHMPSDSISEQIAQTRKATVRHIARNRKADLVAKEYAAAIAPASVTVQREADLGCLQHQQWLARLHSLLPTDSSCCEDTQCPANDDLDVAHCQRLFPLWPWSSKVYTFPWKPKTPHDVPQPAKWIGTPSDWQTVCRFLRSLRWKSDPDAITSISELTVLFHQNGWTFEGDPQLTTYFDLHAKLRRAIAFFARSETAQPFPGTLCAALAKAAGKTLPQGPIRGALVFLDDDALVHLVRIFAHGAGRTLACWQVPLL